MPTQKPKHPMFVKPQKIEEEAITKYKKGECPICQNMYVGDPVTGKFGYTCRSCSEEKKWQINKSTNTDINRSKTGKTSPISILDESQEEER